MGRKKSTPALKGPEVRLKDLEAGQLSSSSLDLTLRGSESSLLRPVRCSERSVLLHEMERIRSLILDLRADLAQVKGGTKVKAEDDSSMKALKIARCGLIGIIIILFLILFVLVLILIVPK